MYVLFGTERTVGAFRRLLALRSRVHRVLELSAFLSSEAFLALALTEALPWEGSMPVQLSRVVQEPLYF